MRVRVGPASWSPARPAPELGCWAQHPTMVPLRACDRRQAANSVFRTVNQVGVPASLHDAEPANRHRACPGHTNPRRIDRQFSLAANLPTACAGPAVSWALASPRRHGRPLHHQGAWQGYVMLLSYVAFPCWHTHLAPLLTRSYSHCRCHPKNRPERRKPMPSSLRPFRPSNKWRAPNSDAVACLLVEGPGYRRGCQKDHRQLRQRR